jgi:hypothetical protein
MKIEDVNELQHLCYEIKRVVRSTNGYLVKLERKITDEALLIDTDTGTYKRLPECNRVLGELNKLSERLYRATNILERIEATARKTIC